LSKSVAYCSLAGRISSVTRVIPPPSLRTAPLLQFGK
jgi:hypothetical protein